MSELTRRAFITAVPAATAVVSFPAAAVAVEASARPTPEAQLEQAVKTMEAAMIRIHGEGVRIIRNETRAVAFLEPDRPRIVEFAGAGFYEVERGGITPIYFVERAAKFDCPREGRCFRLIPRDAKHLGTHYHFEHHLRTVLIRKI